MASRWCALVHRSYNSYLSKTWKLHVLQRRWFAQPTTGLSQPQSPQDRISDSPSDKGATEEDITSGLTADDRERIHQLFEAHVSVGNIAKQTGLRPLVVWKYLHQSKMLSNANPRPMGNAWTDAEHIKLAELRRRRLSHTDIAAHLGRSLTSVRGYIASAHKKGKEIYSLEDLKAAIKLREQGMLPRKIAQSLGCPTLAVHHMLRSRMPRVDTTWDQVKKLFDLREAGSSWAQIAEDLGSQSTVARWKSAYYNRTRATKPSTKPSKRPERRRPWTESQKHELLRLRNDLRLPFSEIAKLLRPRRRSVYEVADMYKSLNVSVPNRLRPLYSAQERDTIVRLIAAGLSYEEIAAKLPGRTKDGVKVAYYATMRGRYTIHDDGSVQWQDPIQGTTDAKDDGRGQSGKMPESTPDTDARKSSKSA